GAPRRRRGARLRGQSRLRHRRSRGVAVADPRAGGVPPGPQRRGAAPRPPPAPLRGPLDGGKPHGLGVPYRLVAAGEVAAVEAAVGATLAGAPDGLGRTGGKEVYELRGRLPWDKGGAVAWLLNGLGLNGPDVLPLYLGDDETDEDAFAMLCERGGVGVLVAPQPQRTLAHYRLDDPDAVGRFLRELLEVVTR